MEIILIILLIVFIVALCCLVAIASLKHRLQSGQEVTSLENAEVLRDQGMITDEEFESIRNGEENFRGFAVDSCTISSEELMEAIKAAIRTVDELESDSNYESNKSWARAFGIKSDLNLTLKELTLTGMKIARPRPAIDLLTEVLAMNIPIDAIEITHTKGETAMPNYRAAARMLWVKMRNRLSEPISLQKEIHSQHKVSEQALLTRLVPIVIRDLDMPAEAAGFAVIFALMSSKIDFGAFSEDDDEPAGF